MGKAGSDHKGPLTHAGSFATTHWSVVLSARGSESPRRQVALAKLCETYWLPLYAFLRRSGYAAADAEDLAQGFFAQLLNRRDVEVADPQRGRFRSFLLTCLKHYVANEHRAAAALKRGGGQMHRGMPLDFSSAESRYTQEPAHDATAERLFERRWALTVLDRATQKLASEMKKAGKERQFEVLGPLLGQPQDRGQYDEPARLLDMTEGAVRTAMSRLRQRSRLHIREEVMQTVEDPALVDDEIRELMAALAK